MLSALCHRHGCAADLLPAHTNTGSRPCSSWPNLCTRTHAHARSFAGVCPQPTPPGRSSPFSLSPFPCLVHAINFVSLPWPSHRRSARTHTHATEGPSPLLHLSVTVLDVPLCRHREPQRTGARVSVEPSTPISNLLATLTLNTASPKFAHHALVSVSSLCTCRRFRVAPASRSPTFARMRTHTPEGSSPSALPVQPHRYPCAPSRSIFARIHVIPTGAAQEFASMSPISPRSGAAANPDASAHVVPQSHQTRGRTILAALIPITSRP
jgi:hypothetical protein